MFDLFTRTRFIMVGTSHPGNVGSAARAIKTMGFTQLVLASPKDKHYLQHPEAIALASGAADILQNAQVYDSLTQALSSTTLSFALTARSRDMGPPAMDIRHAAQEASAHLQHSLQTEVAIILGPERIGLNNEEVSHCHRLCHIPANPAYSSLNVAQALQLAAWELRYAFMPTLLEPLSHAKTVHTQVAENTNPASWDANTVMEQLRDSQSALSINQALAPQAKVEAFIEHWQEALIHLDFLNPRHPKKLMPRMRYLFNRCHMTQEETDMMRGVCTQILKTPRDKPMPPTLKPKNEP